MVSEYLIYYSEMKIIFSKIMSVFALMISVGYALAEQDANTAVFVPPIQQKNSYLELAHSQDKLSGDYQNWRSNQMNLFLSLPQKDSLSIELNRTQRFGLQDSSVYLNYTRPMQGGAANIELGYTPEAEFLFKRMYGVGWNGVIGGGYGYILAYRQRSYRDTLSDSMNLTLEKYFSDYRIAYTNTISSIDKSQTEQSHRLQLQWIGEANNRLGLTYASGNEPVYLGPSSLTAAHVSTVQMDAVWWVKDIGISAAIWRVVQGNFYERTGAQLGLRLAF